MATKPAVVTLKENSTPDVVANILASDPVVFANAPAVENTAESIRTIGNYIFEYSPRPNAFLNALVNRIGMVLITSKLYSNPLARFKKGMLEFGEAVEEIFVELAKPHQFDPAVAETNIFKREIPDVRAAYHVLNFQKFYKVTISNDQLRQAFLSWQGITDLIARIVDSLYTSMNYDEFLVMKYQIAQAALNGNLYAVNTPAVASDTASEAVTKIKGISNTLTFMNTNYNMAGVHTYTDKRNQILLINSDADAVIDVDVLAAAFNMDKAEFMGQRVLVDSFSNIDSARLALLFADDSSYTPLTTEEIQQLATIPCVLVDTDWFMIFDHYMNMTEQYNGEGLYWQYWLHCWRIFSVSPFANGIVFTTATPAVTAVNVSPNAVTVNKGASTTLSATVTTTGFATKSVTWTSSSANTTVDSNGNVTVGSGETNSTVTITATSTFDNTKKGTCTITVPA